MLDRVLAFGDAWFPNYATEGILERAAELRARADRPIDLRLPPAGRGPVERALDKRESAVAELYGN